MHPDAISKYANGRITITEEAVIKMQDLAGINADFILNGNLPMMLDEAKAGKPYDIKYKGPAPVIKHAALKTIEQQQEITEKTRGIIPHSILETRGRKGVLIPQGKINIVDVTINGIQEPSGIIVKDYIFIEQYKSVLLLKTDCLLVLDKSYYVDDYVFISVDGIFGLAFYQENDIIVDCASGKVIEGEDISIYGAIFSVILRPKKY